MAVVGLRQGDICSRNVSWADLSSDEEDGAPAPQASRMSAPTLDDSYREAPLQFLEDSREGLNKLLAGAADLEAESVQHDFGFLIRGASSRQSSKEDSMPTWQPNVHAPEFIPTLGSACPVMNIYGAIREVPRPLSSPRLTDASAGSPSSKSEALQTPEKVAAAAQLFRKKKQRPPAIQEPAQKRTRSEERQQPSLSPGNHAMPEVSEDVWHHRLEVREKALVLGKDTPEYRWYSELKQREAREDGEPVTPDPRDRTISKRQWKYTLQQWRTRLKELYCDEGHGSVDSVEEWQSEGSPSMQEPEAVLSC